MGNHSLYIFTLEGCGRCAQLKKRIRDISVPFNEVDIEKNSEIWESVVESTGNEYLPVLFFREGETEKGPIFCPMKDYNTDEEVLEIVGKYMEIEKGS